jgi:hypothetical protein
MDELKKDYRELEEDTTDRSTGPESETGTADRFGGVGEEASRDLGDLGDDIRDAGDRTFPEVEPSDKHI